MQDMASTVSGLTLECYIQLHQALTKGKDRVQQVTTFEQPFYKNQDLKQLLNLHGLNCTKFSRSDVLKALEGCELVTATQALDQQEPQDIGSQGDAFQQADAGSGLSIQASDLEVLGWARKTDELAAALAALTIISLPAGPDSVSHFKPGAPGMQGAAYLGLSRSIVAGTEPSPSSAGILAPPSQQQHAVLGAQKRQQDPPEATQQQQQALVHLSLKQQQAPSAGADQGWHFLSRGPSVSRPSSSRPQSGLGPMTFTAGGAAAAAAGSSDAARNPNPVRPVLPSSLPAAAVNDMPSRQAAFIQQQLPMQVEHGRGQLNTIAPKAKSAALTGGEQETARPPPLQRGQVPLIPTDLAALGAAAATAAPDGTGLAASDVLKRVPAARPSGRPALQLAAAAAATSAADPSGALDLGSTSQQPEDPPYDPWLMQQLQELVAAGAVADTGAASSAGGSLKGRRVAFALLEELSIQGPRGTLLKLPEGVYQGRVNKYLGRGCSPQVCEVGCSQEHEYYQAKVIPPHSGSVAAGRPVLLDLDLAPRLRCCSWEDLLQLEPEQLQDAWVLLAVRSEGLEQAEGLSQDAAAPRSNKVAAGPGPPLKRSKGC